MTRLTGTMILGFMFALSVVTSPACGGVSAPSTAPQTVEGRIADYGVKVIKVSREVRDVVETFHATGMISTDDTRVIMTTFKHLGTETQRLAGVLTEIANIRAAGGATASKASQVRQVIASIRSLLDLVPDQVADPAIKQRLKDLMNQVTTVLGDLSSELVRWEGV